jgi:hypothetical protein
MRGRFSVGAVLWYTRRVTREEIRTMPDLYDEKQSVIDFILQPFQEGDILSGIGRIIFAPIYILLLIFGPLWFLFP